MLVRDARLGNRQIRTEDFRASARGYGVGGCPPGLESKGCMPPGLAAKLLVVPVSTAASIAALSSVPLSAQYLYPDTNDYYYRYGGDYLYRVDRSSSLIDALLPLAFGGYAPGLLPCPIPTWAGKNPVHSHRTRAAGAASMGSGSNQPIQIVAAVTIVIIVGVPGWSAALKAAPSSAPPCLAAVETGAPSESWRPGPEGTLSTPGRRAAADAIAASARAEVFGPGFAGCRDARRAPARGCATFRSGWPEASPSVKLTIVNPGFEPDCRAAHCEPARRGAARSRRNDSARGAWLPRICWRSTIRGCARISFATCQQSKLCAR